MLCRKDFGLKDIRPHTILCELHFTNDANLDHRTNLSLEPKPHRSCPPGFAPKANPVPKEWIDAALKNLENPFREKVLEYVEQQKAKLNKVPEPKNPDKIIETIISLESKDPEICEISNKSGLANSRNDEGSKNDENECLQDNKTHEKSSQGNIVKEECLETNKKQENDSQEVHIQQECHEGKSALLDYVQEKYNLKEDSTEENSQENHVQDQHVQDNYSQGEFAKVKQVKHVQKKLYKRPLSELVQMKDLTHPKHVTEKQLQQTYFHRKYSEGLASKKMPANLACYVCSRAYQSPEELKTHVKVHEKEKKNFACYI
jgi:hypothetical protein